MLIVSDFEKYHNKQYFNISEVSIRKYKYILHCLIAPLITGKVSAVLTTRESGMLTTQPRHRLYCNEVLMFLYWSSVHQWPLPVCDFTRYNKTCPAHEMDCWILHNLVAVPFYDFILLRGYGAFVLINSVKRDSLIHCHAPVFFPPTGIESGYRPGQK